MKLLDRFLTFMKLHNEYECIHYLNVSEKSSSYRVDFWSCKELSGCKTTTFIYKVIFKDGHETGVVLVVIPYLEQIELHGDDFGRLTEDDTSYLFDSIKQFYHL